VRSLVHVPRTAAKVILALTIGFACVAQDESQLAQPNELLVEVMPQFVSTVRANSWAPVDILVNNNKQDISGSLELVLMRLDERIGPNYRVRVESPKGSRKRFRIYCNFQDATEISVMLYNGRRAALSARVTARVNTIAENDVLALILDDQPEDYGFLFNVVKDLSQTFEYHRESLRTEELSQLPEYPQCYDPYTMIVLGRIDPEAVPARQRELFRRYVEYGGIIVVCLGENSPRYRGTWVEELAGVTYGDVESSDELALARRVFNEAGASGAREDKPVVFSKVMPTKGILVPASTAGNDNPESLPISTLRPLGAGHVASLAVDVSGRALHGSIGYSELWRSMIRLREESLDLHYDYAASQAEYTLPSATGIRVFPRSSVLIYLGLYFLVGIVGNWIFWSLLKRREMAWVCLIFISFGFTTYALVYGTAGRAKQTEVAQMEVLRLPRDGATAKLRSTVGVVAARTSRYALTFPRAYPLVSDVAGLPLSGMTSQSSLLSRVNAFQFMQGPTSTVDNFTVGASTMRLIQVESEMPFMGNVEGSLVWDERGIHGTLTNNTGLKIDSPFLIVNGRKFSVPVSEGVWNVDVPTASITARSVDFAGQNTFYGSMYSGELMSINELQDAYLNSLLTEGSGWSFYDARLGPFICGWVDSKPVGSVDIGEEATERIYATLLVADIGISRLPSAGPRRLDLEVSSFGTGGGGVYSGWNQMNYITTNEPVPAFVVVPRQFIGRSDVRVMVEVFWNASSGGECVFLPKGAPLTWPAENMKNSEAQQPGSTSTNVNTYEIPDWNAHLNADTGLIEGAIMVIPQSDSPRSGYGEAMVRAHILDPQTDSYGGDWKLWQS